MAKGKRLDVAKKNRGKRIKVVWQVIVLAAAAYWLIHQFVDYRSYQEPDRREWTQTDGYLAISYFGLERTATPKLLSKAQLHDQLGVLADHGYVTISQQDVIDFHTQGKPLPDRALFLAFEDGRNDSGLFAQSVLEKYNYRATMMTYADKIGNSQGKFLQPKDLIRMRKSGYWEMGSNGYRLTYINIFDRDGAYDGIKDEVEVTDKNQIAYYNHYLMDFIRDWNMIPVETRDQMQSRISADYDAMYDGYTEALGEMPGTYMIMHANALYGTMNPLVSMINDRRIREIFELHFNREGTAYNAQSADRYNLTRIQPLSYWSTNHLLMKIRKDAGHDVAFVTGDHDAAKQWTLDEGAVEFAGNQVILTSPPAQEALIRLNGGTYDGDLRLRTRLGGNVVGRQTIYLRYASGGAAYLRVVLENNVLFVEAKEEGAVEATLYEQELDKLQWSEADLRFDKASIYSLEQALSGRDDEDQYPPNIRQTRTLDLRLHDDQLAIILDGGEAIRLAVDTAPASGEIALAARYHEDNEKDDIYDGVFTALRVEKVRTDEEKSEMWFTNQYSGWAGAVAVAKQTGNAVLNWMMDTF